MDICLPLVTTRSVRGTIHIRSGRQSIGRSLRQSSNDFANSIWRSKHLLAATTRTHPDLTPAASSTPIVGIVRFVDLVRRFWEENSFCE